MSVKDYFIFSILIAGIISLVRFSMIRREYYPFIFVIWLACINELLNFVLYKAHIYTVFPNNIYSLLEGLLMLWFFENMGTFRRIRGMRYILSVFIIGVWIADNVAHHFSKDYNSYFNIACSFILSLLAITTINNLLVSEKKVLTNPAFLICCSAVIFFTYMIVVETFWIYGLDASKAFQAKVFNIQTGINLFCNLLYAFAVIWMRKKQEFTLQF